MQMLRPALTLLCFSALTFAQTPDRTAQLLERLSNAAGPSGFEEPIRKIMVSEIQPYVTRLSYDGLGSIIAEQGTTGPRIMIDAHMDELGGVTRRITPNGLLTMQMLGGWLDQALPDQRWVILGSKGPVYAVTGIRDIHVTPLEERSHVFPRNSLFLDVGASNADQARQMGLDVGDPVVPDSPFRILNGTGNYLGKAWDDRVGCAVLVETLRRLSSAAHPNHLLYAITTQEEIGLRGARSAAQTIKPDLAVAVEGGITGDVFPGHPEETQSKLGAGPGFFVFNSSPATQSQTGRLREKHRRLETNSLASRSGQRLRRRLRRDPKIERRRPHHLPRRPGPLHSLAQRHPQPSRLRSRRRPPHRRANRPRRLDRCSNPRLRPPQALGPSLHPQRLYRVDLRRTHCRHITRNDGHGRQQTSHRRERNRVDRTHSVNQARHIPSKRQRGAQSNPDPDQCLHQPALHDVARHILRLCPDRHTNANLARPQRYRIRQHAIETHRSQHQRNRRKHHSRHHQVEPPGSRPLS